MVEGRRRVSPILSPHRAGEAGSGERLIGVRAPSLARASALGYVGERRGGLPQWPWGELSLPRWGSGLGLVTSFPARLGKWTLGRWDKGLVEVGGAAVKIGLKLVNIFVTFFLGRKCGDFSRRFGWGREFSRES
jgi:hypothetical protein